MSKSAICTECGRECLVHTEAEIKNCWSQIQSKSWIAAETDYRKRRQDVSRQFGSQTFQYSEIDYAPELTGWIDSDKTSLYIYGGCGTGKTYAGRSILHQALSQRKTVGEITAHRLLSMARRFDGHITTAKYSQFKFLMIDDIDKPDWTAKDVSFLWELLDSRATNGGRTVITSNVKPEDLRKVLNREPGANGSVIESALQRLAPVEVVELTGKSMRGSK
jgi:DNA replication protein DnaC